MGHSNGERILGLLMKLIVIGVAVALGFHELIAEALMANAGFDGTDDIIIQGAFIVVSIGILYVIALAATWLISRSIRGSRPVYVSQGGESLE
jgi:hypothetical protein